MGPCEQAEEEKNLDTAGKRAAALASSLAIFSYPNEKNMIKESLKQKPKHLLHVFQLRLEWGVYFSAAVSFVFVVVVISELTQQDGRGKKTATLCDKRDNNFA